MNTLYLLCGLPFSGKTTLARALVRYLDCHYVSLDRIKEDMGLGLDGRPISQEQWESVQHIARFRVLHYLKLHRMKPGSDLVVDDRCCSRRLRDRWRDLARSAGYNMVVIHVATPLPEIRNRIELNRLMPQRRGITDGMTREVLEAQLSRFEAPVPGENTLIFEPWFEVNDWLHRYIPRDEDSKPLVAQKGEPVMC